MNELETLQQVNAQTHLVASIADKDQQLRNVAEFTRRAAWALRDQGYGNVRKTIGTQVNGLSTDVIMRGADGAAFDIVVGKQTDDPQVAFNQIDPLDPRAFFVAPQPEPDQAPAPQPQPDPPPPPPPPVDDPQLELLIALLGKVIDVGHQLSTDLQGVSLRLDRLQQSGIKIHL